MRRKDFLKKFYIPKDFSHLLDPVGKPLTKEETAFVASYDRREFMKKTAKALIWTVGIGAIGRLWKPKPLYASRLFNGTNESLGSGTAIVSDYPLTVSAWFRADQLATTKGDEMAIFSINHTSDTLEFFNFRIDDSNSQNRLQIVAVNDAQSENALTTNEITANTWHHAFGVWASSTSRTVILDGDVSSKGTNTNTVDFPTLNNTNIGKLAAPGDNFDFFDGRIAEIPAWDVSLADNEATSLSNGVSLYRIRPVDLIHHWPLYGRNSPEPDFIGTVDMTLENSPSQADHSPGMPNFALSSERSFQTVAAAAVRRRPPIIMP